MLLLVLAVAGRAVAGEVGLEVPARAAPGESFEVHWHGPEAPGDFIALAEPGAAASDFVDYARTSRGTPARLEVPAAGDYEARCVSAAALRVLSSAPLTVGGVGPSSATTVPAPEVTLMALAAVDRGRDFRVAWTGPGAAGDRIALLLAGEDAAAALASRPVGEGSSLDSRVHAMSGGGDRILFDGRSIFGAGEGLGYLEGVPGATGGGEGAMSLVRGGDYWLSVVEGFKRGGQILKDPERMLAGFAGGGFPMGGMPMQGPIMSAAVEGMTFDEDCGYTVPGEFELLEDSPERIRFRVTGDLFDMMRAAGLGGDASTCEIMRAAWVEFASFEVSLPNELTLPET